jgi:hypothetical protein
VTYRDFNEFGVCWDAIGPGIREVEALGSIRVTEEGRAGNGEWRKPNKFALTHLPTVDNPKATEDWRRIKTIGEATTIATSVRKTIKKKQNASRIKHHSPHRIKRSESPNFQSDKPDHYPRRKTGSLSISRAASAAGAPVLPLSSKPKLVWSTPVLTEVFGAEKDELLTILAQIPIPIPGKLAAISGKFVQ